MIDPCDDQITVSRDGGFTAALIRQLVDQIPDCRLRAEPFMGRNPRTGETTEVPAGPADIQLRVIGDSEQWFDAGRLDGNDVVFNWYYGDLQSPDSHGQALVRFALQLCSLSGAVASPPLPS